MRLNVIGLGMVGLPTALLFAEAGVDTLGVDLNEARLAAYRRALSDRRLEEDLLALLRRTVERGAISFADGPRTADVHIIAVGTPMRDGVPDLAGVRAAMAEVVPFLRAGDLLVLESTMPPGSTARLAAEFGVRAGVLVAHAPERVTPGDTLREMRENARIIGGLTRHAGEACAALYRAICIGQISVVDATTAEFTKLIENAYRDVNIALANELSLMAVDLGVDIWQAIDLANAHPRVHLHRPGPGVGGHCIGVAPLFLRAAAPQHYEVMAAARRRNVAMPAVVANLAVRLCSDRPRPRIALLGLAYKPDVADDRDSPSLAVADELARLGASVVAHDPLLQPDRPLEQVLESANCVILLVRHREYLNLQPGTVAALVADRRIVDAVNGLERDAWEGAGFEMTVLGQPTVEPAQI